MFWGEYSHQLDKKGRLIIPARLRPYLLDGAMLTRGLDANLVIYPQEAWRNVTQQLNQMPITQASARALRRLLLSGAMEISADRQGRILIPAYLRDYASIKEEVLIVGMETFIELWEPEHWRTTLDGASEVLADSDHLLRLSL